MNSNKIEEYTVYIEDKFHQPLCTKEDIAEYRHKFGVYNNYEEAIATVKEFLDKDFASIAKDRKNRDDIQSYWAFYGEDLFIIPTPAGIESFSSSDYIQRKIDNYVIDNIPQKGDIIYIDSALYIDSPFRDRIGGKAKIQSVKNDEGKLCVVVEEYPTTSFYWESLLSMQDYLKDTFGDTWAGRSSSKK